MTKTTILYNMGLAGTDLNVSGDLDNFGYFFIDDGYNNDPSHLNIPGALTNGPMGYLRIYNGSVVQAGAVRNDGWLSLDSFSWRTSTGSSLVASSLDNTGSIDLSSGATVTVSGAMSNSGRVSIAAGSSVSLGSGPYTQTAGSTTVAGDLAGALNLNGGTFVDAGGHFGDIQFGGAATFVLQVRYDGVISGFSLGDALDFTYIPYASGQSLVFRADNGAAKIYDLKDASQQTLATINLSASDSLASLLFADDGNGGTLAVFGSPAALGNNFNGGRAAGLLTVDTTTGQVSQWTLSRTGPSSSSIAGFDPASGWSVAGTGDFNGDGVTDVLLRNNNAGVSAYGVWQVQNGTFSSFSALGGFANGSGWSVLGAGDFNADGASDILLASDVGGFVQLYDWEISNGAVAGLHPLGMGYADNSGWSVLGVGDFNGDGASDVLLENTQSLQVGVLSVSNGAATGYTPLGIALSGWSFGGTGDFNGDGRSDVLWRQLDGPAKGTVNIWNTQAGLGVQTTQVIDGDPFRFGAGGQLNIADFNGDGTSDLIWSSNGQVQSWLMRSDQPTLWTDGFLPNTATDQIVA